MGITERHWFEDEEPELTERQLEDIVYENKKAYDNGYVKGFHDAKTLEEYFIIVKCKECKHRDPEDHKCNCGHDIQWQLPRPDDWFCADGQRKR